MSLTVSANEFGLIRVFRLSDSLRDALGGTADMAPLETALGAIIAQPADVQVVSPDALRDMGLSTFLAMAYGIDAGALAATPGLEDGPDAAVAILRSGAFGGAAVALNDSPDARLIATLQEDTPAAASLGGLQSQAAMGAISPPPGKPAKSDARIGGMVATLALLVLFALVGIMIWVAG